MYAWRAPVFGIVVAETGSVRRDERHFWRDMSVVAALRSIATGVFESLLLWWEAKRVRGKRIAALKARHGANPSPVVLPANPTVQQLVVAVGVPEVQKHLWERQGRLLGLRNRIAGDVLAILCDDYNVTPNTNTEAEAH